MTLEVNRLSLVQESQKSCNSRFLHHLSKMGAAVLGLFLTANPMGADTGSMDLSSRTVVSRTGQAINDVPSDEETDSDDEVDASDNDDFTTGIESASEVSDVEDNYRALTTSELIYVIHDPKTQTDSYLIGTQHNLESGQVAIKSPVLPIIAKNCPRVYTEAGDLYSPIRSTPIQSLCYDDVIVKMAINENAEIIALDKYTNVVEKNFQCAELAKKQGRELSEAERMWKLMSDPGESNPKLLKEIQQSKSSGLQTPFASEAWSHGDAEYLTKEREHSQSQYPNYYERLHTRREKIWLEKLSKDLCDGQGSICIAVGSSHLFGKDGMIANLQKQGFAVSRAPFSVCSEKFSSFEDD